MKLNTTKLSKLSKTFQKKYKEEIKDIILFGSSLRGKLEQEDIDILILFNKKTNKEIEYEFQDWRPSDQKVYISDIRKVKSLLEWVPKINPEEGVNKIVEWVKNNINLFA